MHITAGVWINDDEPGILEDPLEWLDKLAPPSWRPQENLVAAALPWQAIAYAECDGRRDERLVIKLIGGSELWIYSSAKIFTTICPSFVT
jgi:thiamine phosphate synthase YjbQ (UPF0047 family)